MIKSWMYFFEIIKGTGHIVHLNTSLGKYRQLILDCLEFLPRYSSDLPQELDPRNVFGLFASNRIDVISQFAQSQYPEQFDSIESELNIVLNTLDRITNSKGVPRFRYKSNELGGTRLINNVRDAIGYLDSFLIYENSAKRCKSKDEHKDIAMADLLQKEKKYLQEYNERLESWFERNWKWLIATIIAIAALITQLI